MDSQRKKQIIYISLGIIILGVIAYLLYRYLQTAPAEPKPAEVKTTGKVQGQTFGEGGKKYPSDLKQGESLDITNRQKLFRLTDFPVIAPSLNREENKVLFYKKDGGNLLYSDFQGKSQGKISNITIIGVIDAVWSPARDRSAVFYLDQENVKGFIQASSTGVSILPQNIKSFSWSPDGKSAAYFLQKDKKLELMTADSAGKNARVVFSTPILDARLAWVSAEKIEIKTAPSGLSDGFDFILSAKTGLLTRIFGPLSGLTTNWSQDGSKVLTSVSGLGGKEITSTVFNSLGREPEKLKIKTIAEKCAWASNKEIYCAVPKFLPQGAVLPDDYLTGEVNTSDMILKINLEKNDTSFVFAEGDFDVSDLIVTKAQDFLFFADRNDGNLWGLKLK